MKKIVLTTLTIICSLTVTGEINSRDKATSRAASIREVKIKSRANRQAPAECVAVFRAFFRYIQKSEPGILTDVQAQNRWLSRLMRSSLAAHVSRAGSPKENPDYPSNQTFVGVWNYPTTFSIVGSRHYDTRNAHNPEANRVVIDVLYRWEDNKDGNPENQYPGKQGLHSFIFVHEDGAWKLDDIYIFAGEYAIPGSLRGYFEKR